MSRILRWMRLSTGRHQMCVRVVKHIRRQRAHTRLQVHRLAFVQIVLRCRAVTVRARRAELWPTVCAWILSWELMRRVGRGQGAGHEVLVLPMLLGDGSH